MKDYLEEFRYDINLIGEGTVLQGNITLERLTRLSGEIEGKIKALPGVVFIVGENGYANADIEGDTILVDGFVRGNIIAKSKCVVNSTATVIGNITADSLEIKTGAHFEGIAKSNK